jgi:hypothetical protein
MLKNDTLFVYSKDWKKEEFITISSESYFDIAVSKDFVYIIKIPKSGFQGAITFVLGGVPGLVAGPLFEKKNRDKMRTKWLDVNNQFISDAYTKYLYMQIPIQDLKNSFTRVNNKFKINFNKVGIKLKGQKEEMEKIAEFIK